MNQILHYIDMGGNDLYQNWLDDLRDRIAKISIIKRVARVELGLLGDSKYLRDRISELRIDVGVGYRVYFAQVGHNVLLLTSGGDKSWQNRDIERAVGFLKDWEKRNG